MDSDPMEGPGRIATGERLNVFALVIYIPGPLGKFLDDLRRELVPGCNPHAHVSLLPPRPLCVDWRVASDYVRSLTETWRPFEIELTRIAVFPVTDVIYIEIGRGADELHRLHYAMNASNLASPEPFTYHPHITLAQELQPGQVTEIEALARRRWNEFTGDRRFRAEHAVFVQNTLEGCWIDLADYHLGSNSSET